VLGHRTGSNPARYVDHLQLVLPRSRKRSHVRHHPALPWEDVPGFVRELEQRPRRAARILHLLILTATRTNEVRFARPEEFDLDNRAWFPVNLPRLDSRMHGISGFASGRSAGSHHHFADDSGLPASGPAGATARDDGGLGCVLCQSAYAYGVSDFCGATAVCRVS
jgi:integrase